MATLQWLECEFHRLSSRVQVNVPQDRSRLCIRYTEPGPDGRIGYVYYLGDPSVIEAAQYAAEIGTPEARKTLVRALRRYHAKRLPSVFYGGREYSMPAEEHPLLDGALNSLCLSD